MANRKLIISCCDQCPHFDHQYYSYNETCMKLDRKIKKNNDKIYDMVHTIPDECPLEKE